MFDLWKFTRTAVAVATLGIATVPATAATVSQSAQPLTANTNPLASSTTGTVYQNVTGSIDGVRRDVWEGSALAGTGVYTSISGGASATFSFGGQFSTFSLVWGSPDDYNKIEFYLGSTKIDEVTTASVVGPVLPCCVSGQTNIANSLVTFTNLLNGGKFDTVVLSSSANAYEVGNLMASVPLPAGGLLLLGALGGLAAWRRRKAA